MSTACLGSSSRNLCLVKQLLVFTLSSEQRAVSSNLGPEVEGQDHPLVSTKQLTSHFYGSDVCYIGGFCFVAVSASGSDSAPMNHDGHNVAAFFPKLVQLLLMNRCETLKAVRCRWVSDCLRIHRHHHHHHHPPLFVHSAYSSISLLYISCFFLDTIPFFLLCPHSPGP